MKLPRVEVIRREFEETTGEGQFSIAGESSE